MEVTIDTSQSTVIDWGIKGDGRIIQNIKNLLNTRKYEVAYDRTLGLSGDFIDKPADEAISILTAEITDLISDKEPRAELMEVLFAGIDTEGNMRFKVVIDI